MQEQRNLLLAIVLSVAVLFGYQFLIPKKPAPAPQPAPIAATDAAPTAAAVAASPGAPPAEAEPLADAPRVAIETPRLRGSLSLAGGRIDDLVLADYWLAADHKTNVSLFVPAGGEYASFFESGWTAEGGVATPDARTIWTKSGGDKLTPTTPLTLTWDNGGGLIFTRVIAVDDNYLFTIRQSVANHGAAAIVLKPFAAIYRRKAPDLKVSFGSAPTLAGFYGEGLDEVAYSDLAKEGPVQHQATGGWAGFNDKYFLMTAIPQRDMATAITLSDDKSETDHRFSVAFQGAPQTVAPGATIEATASLFAGAKEAAVLAKYDHEGITRIDRTIDFGWLYIPANAFFIALDYIYKQVGNFGVAILIFNVLLKIILFPLQDRSFHQMARMRDLQPKIAALKEKYGEDREKMATAQMELFKKEKINPASGCLPILVQIPIFYSLYRVLSTSIEMRQAPFFGWIQDLSAPDTTNVFNLFGLLPIEFTGMFSFLHLGAWPLIYGATMFWQQKMTPTPTTDPTQARIMLMMPLIFMFFFAQAPAGLTIYYSWNAVLTMAQMALIRHRSNKRQAALAEAKNKG